MEDYLKDTLFDKVRELLHDDPEMQRLFGRWHTAADRVRAWLAERGSSVVDSRKTYGPHPEELSELAREQDAAYAAWRAYVWKRSENVRLTPEEEAEAIEQYRCF